MKNFLAIPLLAVLFALTACHPSHNYLAEGDLLFAAQKYPEAVLTYRKAIQRDPGSAEAFYKLSLAQKATGNYAGAYDSLRHATSLNPDLDKAQIELGNFYLGGYLMEPSKNLAASQKISAIAGRLLSKNPQSFAGLRFRGYLALSDRKPEEAISFFQRAHAADPTQPDVVLGLTQALLLAGRYPEARQTGADLIEQHKTFGSVYDVLYAYEMSAGHAADAEALLKLKLKNNPRSQDAVLQLAQHYWRMDKHAASFQLLDAMLHEDKIPWQTYADAADFYRRNEEWDHAIEALTLGLKAHPEDQAAFAGAKAQILSAQDKPREAIALLADTLRVFPDAKDLREMRAVLLLDSHDTADLALALRDLQSLAVSSTDDMAIAFQLGRAFSLNGLSNKATRQFELVARKEPENIPALLALAESTSSNKKFELSLEYSERILQLQPALRNAKLLHATALVGLGRLEEAHAAYIHLVRDQPKYTEAKLQLALLDVLLKRFPESEKLFRELYQPKTGDFRALKGIVELYVAQGQTEKALQLLNTELAHFPDSMALHSILAATASRAGNVDLAIRHYEYLVAKGGGDDRTYTELGGLYDRKRDLPRAIAMFQKALDLAPSDWRHIVRLAAVQQESGMRPQAAGNYRHAMTLGGDGGDLFNNLAYLEAEMGSDLDDAFALAQRALTTSPGNPQFTDTLGFVYLKKHDTAGALQIFQTLLKRFPGNSGFRYHLALALLQSGDRAQGARELRTAVAGDPSLESEARAQGLLGPN